MKIEHLYISPGHNFFGRHGLEAGTHPALEQREIECVAGSGIKGDRFYDFKPDYKGQITFFSGEVYEELCERLQVSDRGPEAFRRNVIVRGVDLNTLIGQEFEVQGVRFMGTGESKPCSWMNHAFAEGAEALLQGRGGLRARILTSGVLSVGK
ncbi:MAG: MOSC domain-containing protein [Chthoniobacteraceae bacterium]